MLPRHGLELSSTLASVGDPGQDVRSGDLGIR